MHSSFIAVAQLLLSQPMNFSAHPRSLTCQILSHTNLHLYQGGEKGPGDVID